MKHLFFLLFSFAICFGLFHSKVHAQSALKNIGINKWEVKKGNREFQMWIDVVNPPQGKAWRIDTALFIYRDAIGLTERKYAADQVKGVRYFSEASENSVLRINFRSDLPRDGSIEPELIYSLGSIRVAPDGLFVKNLILPGFGDLQLEGENKHLIKTALFIGATVTGIWAHKKAVTHYRKFSRSDRPSDPGQLTEYWETRHIEFEKAQAAHLVSLGVGVVTATFYLNHQFRFIKKLSETK
jgi:hypothetical protein